LLTRTQRGRERLAGLVPCHTDLVANLTLVISDELLKAARVLALRQGASVNQLVREHLEGLVAQGGRRSAARERLEAARLDYVAEGFIREEAYKR
jgi:hypothetical protein